jgi:dihydroxy-acid dehydratase
MSLPETQMRPTAMLFRNLLAMEVEEAFAPIRSTAWC